MLYLQSEAAGRRQLLFSHNFSIPEKTSGRTVYLGDDSMTRRGTIRIGVLAAGLLLALAGLAAQQHLLASDTQSRLEYSYRRALGDLGDYVSGMRDTLQKAPYASGAAMQGMVSAQLLEQSGGAKAAMAALPLSQEKSEAISRFLSQAGDYALYLARRSAAGLPPDEEAPANLQNLEEFAGKLSQALSGIQARIDTEELSMTQIRSALNNLDPPDSPPLLDGEFDEVAQSFSEFPSLLYDGPFSDHITRRSPLALQGEQEVSRQQAAESAARFLDCSPDSLSFSGEGGSDQLALWCFVDGEGSQVNITKLGGRLCYYKKAGEIAAENLGYEQALEKARATLDKLGVTDCRETYAVTSDRLCTINFAGLASLPDGGTVLCYPDLVKVTIELEQGGTVEVDAVGWLMNRRHRSLYAPSLSEEQAAASLSPLLTRSSGSLAIIPSPGLDELLCWEFPCTSSDGQRFLAYINGETGQEEQLYLLREEESGVLAN